MKILMVNKFLYPNGGSETYIFKIGEYLQREGHEVEYFGMEHEGRIVGNRSACYTSNMDFHTGKLAKLLYPFKILYSLEARKKIRRVLDAFGPDAVHLNNINFQLTPSVIDEVRSYEKKSGRKVRILATAHDYQWVCPNHMLMIPSSGQLCTRCLGGHYGNCAKYRCIHGSRAKSLLGAAEGYLYRLLGTYRKVDAVVCPSAFLAEKLRTNPALRDKLVVLHNFVEAEKRPGAGAPVPGLPEEYVLYFGRYAQEKGIETLLAACRQLPQIPFVFAGSGPLEASVERGPSNVRNVGFWSGEALAGLIQGARFSVYPSEWYENCPFSVMESQMYQTPVLGAAIGGVPELIDAGRTGELFESKDVKSLTEAIRSLWEDRERCRAYRNNCETLAFDTLEAYGAKLTALYQGDGQAAGKMA